VFGCVGGSHCWCAGIPLAEAYRKVGRLLDSRIILERVVEITTSRELKFLSIPAERLLAETLLAEGALDSARERFELVLSDLERSNAQSKLALAWDGYGRLLACQGNEAEARRYLTQAAAAYERLGMRIDPIEVRAELAKLPTS